MTWPLVPSWSPSGTVTPPTLWVDPSDTSTLLDTGGGSISNGETIGTCTSKDATAFPFTQWGSNGRPTFDSSGINGLGTMRLNSQILTTRTSMSTFAAMSGLTVSCVVKRNGALGGQGAAVGFTITATSGNSDFSMAIIPSQDTYVTGGRRVSGDSFVGFGGTILTPTTYIITTVFDYSAAKGYLYDSRVKDVVGAAFQASGTSATPYAISFGSFAQQTGNGKSSPGADCWLGEVLIWKSALTADELVGPHSYLSLKWGVN